VKEMLKVNAYPMAKGTTATVYTGGGGGFGCSFERDPQKVREDYLQEYISREEARTAYGVVLSEIGDIDETMTKSLRNA